MHIGFVLGTSTTLGLAAFAALIVIQVAIATASARKAGHVPGVPIADGPSSFAFRAQRAHQNTLENAVPFLVALAAAVAAGVAPRVVDIAVLVFVSARVAHALAYYAGAQPARTAAFAVGLVAVLTMSVATLA
ncbi:MAG TPA: MAPEG family protein [Kofleriaceae bacterium]|nr:MAPEG family protein [Kofleriaceae bacterium]